jgi:hypothetical protein
MRTPTTAILATVDMELLAADSAPVPQEAMLAAVLRARSEGSAQDLVVCRGSRILIVESLSETEKRCANSIHSLTN